jgi:hypothetical protein
MTFYLSYQDENLPKEISAQIKFHKIDPWSQREGGSWRLPLSVAEKILPTIVATKFKLVPGCVAKWSPRLPPKQKIEGSNPRWGVQSLFIAMHAAVWNLLFTVSLLL